MPTTTENQTQATACDWLNSVFKTELAVLNTKQRPNQRKQEILHLEINTFIRLDEKSRKLF